MPRRRTRKRRIRKRRIRKIRRKTRIRKGGKIIDYWKLRPGMVVKPLMHDDMARDAFPFRANEVWKITNMQNNKMSYDVLSPAGSPPGEILLVIIPILGIRFNLVEKASPQSLAAVLPVFAARKSKKRNPSRVQQLALSKISTLDRKVLKETMPGLLDPKKIKYKT